MRSRILFLSQCLPFPPDSGVTNRTYHILQQLQRMFDVTLVAFSRRNHQPDSVARALAAAALQEEVSDVLVPVPIDSEWSLAAKLRVHASSVLARKPYTFFEYGNATFGRRLETAVDRDSPDMVHMDSIDLYRWLPLLPLVPKACTHHNIESDLLRSRAEHIRGPAVSRYIMHQAHLVENVERNLCTRFDLNIMTSETDAERLRVLAPGARTSVVPNGVDVEYFRPTAPQLVLRDSVAFLGPTYMFPNRDAVEFFLNAIWPLVKNQRPEATLHVIGKNSTGDKALFESHNGVACHGYVPDIRPHFAEAACSVVPLRVGGGTRLKILDAWSMGKAIVSTSIGCEGLETLDGENILIRDEPGEFSDAVVQVLRDDELRNRLGRNGRKTAEETYAWPVVGQKLIALYKDRLAVRSQGAQRASGFRGRL
jgi:glycosyltransferase involved in cell wall biosynthesis